MKKKVLSLALALVMCLGLTVPSFAAEGKLKVNITFDGYLRTEYVKDDYENEFMAVQVVKDGSNVKLECPGAEQLSVEDEYRIFMVEILQYTKGAGWVPGSADPFLDGLELGVGGVFMDASTKTFAATSVDAGSTIFVVGGDRQYDFDAEDYYFDVEETYWMSESGYAQLAPEHKGVPGPNSVIKGVVGPDKPSQPTTPTEPEQPTTPTVTVENIPAKGTAVASTQTVTVDGKKVEFQMYALVDANGNGTNYIKLRDMAQILNGTKAQFSVDYDGTISLTTGQAYASNGSEMNTPFSGDRNYTGGAQSIKINGSAVDMTAITLLDDAGGGYNYFKLRDLGKALGFNVGYSNERGVYIESDKPYVG